MSQLADCYIIDQNKKTYGPLTALDAFKKLEESAFGCLLIRAGYFPVWSEDIEGLEIVLGKGKAASRVTPQEPSARIAVRRNLFDGRRDFDVSCTAHYAEHKAWFENQRKLKLDYPLSDAAESLAPDGSGAKRFASTMVGERKGLFGSLLLLFLGVGFAGVLSYGLGWPKWSFSGGEIAQTDGFAPAAQLVFADASRNASNGEVNLQARDAEAPRLLLHAIERKLMGDVDGFLDASLELTLRRGAFKAEVLPADERLAALRVALSESVTSEIRSSLEQPQAIGLVARAYADALSSVVAETRLEQPPSPSYVLALLGQTSEGALLDSEMIYWGNKAFENEGEVVRLPSAVLTESIRTMSRVSSSVKDGDHLRGWLVSRTLYFAYLYAAGKGDAQLARNVEAFSEDLIHFVAEEDAAIIGLLASEARRPYSLEDLNLRVAARLKLLGRLHAEGDFLCSPARTATGVEFLIQTMRMANAIGGELPGLRGVFADCFVRPAVFLPATPKDTLGKPEELLEFMPSGLAGFSPEWRRFVQVVETHVLTEESLAPLLRLSGESSLDVQWQWRSLVTFASPRSDLRDDLAQAFEALCRSVAEDAKAPRTPFCLVATWNRKDGVLIAQRRQLLLEIQSRFGRRDASEVFFQWLVSAYVTPGVLPGVPGDPLNFSEKNEMRSLLDTDRPQLGTLDWYAKNRIVR